MDAQRGLSVSGHRNTVLCLHLTSDTYHVTPSGRAPRARGKFWIRRVKLRIFRPDPKSHKSEGFPAAQIFKTHKSQNTYCRSAHFSKAVKIVGAQNPRGTTCFVCIGSTVTTLRPDFRAPVARRVVGLRSQFRVEALVWPLSEGIRTRHCHLRHRVSPTEPGDRCESASLDIHKREATM